MKVILDTNVVIHVEDNREVAPLYSEFLQLSHKHSVGLYVDKATFDDVERDPDPKRRAITLSKLRKFLLLTGIPEFEKAELEARYGRISNEHDDADVRLLVALDVNAADYLVTEDIGLRKRATSSNLEERVFSVANFVGVLKQEFEKQDVFLPFIESVKAHSISLQEPIFQSLREDYSPFDSWFAEKCQLEHRECWIIKEKSEIVGIKILKDEEPKETDATKKVGKILKLCTFKVADNVRGYRLGELLLKKIFWHAVRNNYSIIYLTSFPGKTNLIALIETFGFQETATKENNEIIYERTLARPSDDHVVDFAKYCRSNYPHYVDDTRVKKFVVPIQPVFHRRLFPEIAFAQHLPLFPELNERPISFLDNENRTPGNTIRKVYISFSKNKSIKSGDIVLFYQSKNEDML